MLISEKARTSIFGHVDFGNFEVMKTKLTYLRWRIFRLLIAVYVSSENEH